MRTWLVIGWLAVMETPAFCAGESCRLTNVSQLQSAARQAGPTNCCFRLEGTVWWADPAGNELILHDASGTAKVEMDLQGRSVRAGQVVCIEGCGTVIRVGNGFRLGVIGPVVDNNGIHALSEKTGSVYLPAGRQPLRVDWFNDTYEYGLQVEWQGPGLPRQKIPNAVLFRQPTGSAPGLNFAVYDAPGEVLPDFSRLSPVQSGVVSNFDLSILPRTEHVAVRFTGELAVPRAGLYTFFTESDDGSQLFVGSPSVFLSVVGPGAFPPPRRIVPGQTVPETEDFQWATAEGTITFAGETGRGWEWDLSSDLGHLRVIMSGRTPLPAGGALGRQVRVTGVCESARTADGQQVADTLLVPGTNAIEWIPPLPPVVPNGENSAAHLPVLTTAAAVHRLSREEAQRGYPVKIQGVVTCVLPEHQAFTVQDATRGIYVEDHSTSRAFLPQIGEFLDIEGTTDPSLFAPIVKARSFRSLGAGRLPDPIRPTWDQLLNGSLDAQYVELEGIITTVTDTNVTLLTRDGRITAELRLIGGPTATLARYEDALVRIRGCLFANWDYVTHEVKAGEVRIYGAALSVEQPVPRDLFALPDKTVADLLRFDPQAGVFQRVKVSGQIVHASNPEFYLTDGRNALRFITRQPEDLQAGDRVEVVGFPDWSGASPLLREAVARKTGHAPLPPARLLTADDLGRPDYDALRVRVEGKLADVRDTGRERILEIQSGVRTFAARLPLLSPPPPAPPLGSRVELTGVYAVLDMNRAAAQNVSTFELLLNSAQDLRVLARPPWWTLERLLVIVGALMCGLAVTLLWITQLRRQVEQRTAELAAQIRQRQRVEQQHAMEQERARVARDLHDELGSSLTEISMLGARARAAAASEEKRTFYLEQMTEKAREAVAALDEIVWAMNPRHDSLASLVSYFCLFADRFLGLANIAWRLEEAPAAPDCAVDFRHRHQLFLAFKEALTNIVRHSRATEVRWSIRRQGDEMCLTIADNGRGLPSSLRAEAADGLANMRTRLEKLGGRLEIASESGRGTTVKFYFPANGNHDDARHC